MANAAIIANKADTMLDLVALGMTKPIHWPSRKQILNMPRIARQPPGARPTSLIVGFLLFASSQANAATWDIQPEIDVGQGYTSNVELTPQDNHDWITEVAPTISLTRRASQSEATARYKYQQLWYRENSDLDDHYHNFNGRAFARSADASFTVDATAAYDQQTVDPEGAVGFSNLLRTGNRTDVARAQITPTYSNSLAPNVDTRLVYSYSLVDYRNTDDSESTVDDSHRHFIQGVIGDLQSPGLWDWQANYQFSRNEFDDESDAFEYQRAGGEIGREINARTRILFSGGLESDVEDDTRAGDLDATFWNIGFNWQPTSRQSMEARAGERYYGTSYFFKWDRRARQSQLGVSYTEEAVTPNNGLFDLNSTGAPSAGTGARLDSDVYIRRRGSALFTLNFTRNVFNFDTYYEDRDYQTSERSDYVKGVGTSWKRTIGRGTDLTTSVQAEQRGFSGNDDIYRFRVELRHELSRRLSARLMVGRLVRNTQTSTPDYRSNGATLYFTAVL